MNPSTVIQCKHTDDDRELNEQNFERMNQYFSAMVAPFTESHAIIQFAKEAACILPADIAHKMALDIADSLPSRSYALYTYHRPEMPKVTLQVLSDHEYRCHWLASYFKTNVDGIAKFYDYTPTVQAELNAPVDYNPPLDNGFYADEDLKASTT